MEQWIELIDAALKKAGLTASAASKMAVGHAGLIKDMKQNHIPRADRLEKLCHILGIKFMHLDFDEYPDTISEVDTNHLLIPKLSVAASAGGGAVVDQEHVMSHLAFKKAALKKQGLNARNLSAIDVIGDSMMPTLRDGDTVLVDTSNKMLKPEKIVVARIDGDLTVKRLRKLRKKEGWILQSDNPQYDLIPVDKFTAVIGRVVWHAHWLDK